MERRYIAFDTPGDCGLGCLAVAAGLIVAVLVRVSFPEAPVWSLCLAVLPVSGVLAAVAFADDRRSRRK